MNLKTSLTVGGLLGAVAASLYLLMHFGGSPKAEASPPTTVQGVTPTGPISASHTPTPTPAPSPVPTATSTPTTAPQHVLTWINVEASGYGSPVPSPAAYARYVDWALTDSGNSGAAAIHAAGIKIAFYTDPPHWSVSGGQYLDTLLTMSDVAMSCATHTSPAVAIRWEKPGIGGIVYLTDPRIADVATKWALTAAHITSHGLPYDAVFEDTTDSLSLYAVPSGPCDTSTGKVVTASAWQTALAAEQSGLGHPVIYNALEPSGKAVNTIGFGLLAGPALGGLSEHCFENSDPTSSKSGGARWNAEANTEIAAQLHGKLFVCHNEETTDGTTATALDKRRYIYASWLLAYDLGSSIFSTHWAVGASNLRVEPEAGLVPTDPIFATPADIASLMDSHQIFHRQYRHCFLGAVDQGSCDVEVNSDSKFAHTLVVPFASTHALALAGSGVDDGGTAILASSTPPPTLGATEARISFP